MRRKCILAAAVGAAMVIWASSAPAAMITVESATITEGTASVDIDVTISGGEDITSVSLPFVVGDGGPVLDGTETIEITAFDETGGIFDGSFSTVVDTTPDLPAQSATIADLAISEGNTVVSADGLLATFTLDTSTASAGEQLGLTLGAGDFEVSVSNEVDGTAIPTEVATGTLTVTSNVIPEPATLGLLALGGAGLAGQRRRRKAKA